MMTVRYAINLLGASDANVFIKGVMNISIDKPTID